MAMLERRRMEAAEVNRFDDAVGQHPLRDRQEPLARRIALKPVSPAGADLDDLQPAPRQGRLAALGDGVHDARRSEEHTSELQSQSNLVCRLLLEQDKREQ